MKNINNTFIKSYVICLAVFLLLAGLVFAGHQSMSAALVDVEKKKSQVINVLARQREVKEQFMKILNSPEAEAELAGARNRVRVEFKRYDNAVSLYNEKARSLQGQLFIFVFNFPEQIRLSGEVTSW